MKTELKCMAFAITLLAASCTTPKDVSYFQDVKTGTEVTAALPIDIKVRPEDKLSIIITTQDSELSQLFNLVTPQNRLGTVTSDNQTTPYTVDREGNIDMPVLGKVHVAGLNRFEVAASIKDLLQKRDMVKDPVVVVEFVNTGVAILGEVNSPGRYVFNEDRLTIIDAIARAGDLKLSGERTNILVMREDGNGKQTGYRIDLTDMESLAQSPVFYVQQDDIIYVQPNDKSKRETTPNGNTPYTPSFWVSMGSFAVTIATLIITLSK